MQGYHKCSGEKEDFFKSPVTNTSGVAMVDVTRGGNRRAPTPLFYFLNWNISQFYTKK